MLHPLWFLVGYRKMRVARPLAGAVVELCRRNGYPYRDFFFEGEYGFFFCSLPMAKRIGAACLEAGISLEIADSYGVPHLCCRYRRRWGILAGLLAFVAITVWSGQVLWGVRVEGNRALEEQEVLALLETHGVRVGAPLSSLDTGVIEHLVVIDSDEISWISINLVGTVAEVEIREHEEAPKQETYAAANLMAGRWGVVDHFEEVRGNIAVKIGDVVSEGDLLVGGLYETEGGGVRCTCARGKVFARTWRDFAEEIPLQYVKKEYTGRVKTKKSLIFFEKEIKFFTNAGTTYDNYDIIDTIEYWELPGGIRLPVGVRTVRLAEYGNVDARRTPEEAQALAYERLYAQMEAAVPEGELLRKRLTSTLTEKAFVLRCKANYIENIAVVRPIEWEILPPSGGT